MRSAEQTIKQIFQFVAEGDLNAFRQLYNQQWNKLYSFSYSVLKSHAAAEDIVQEVFLKIWANRSKLKQVENPEAYLFIICRNCTINSFQSINKTSAINHTTDQEFFLMEETILAKEMHQNIHRTIQKLPFQQKIIYNLSREEGLTHHEIAEKLGIKKETVKNHLVRALHTIRKTIGSFFWCW